MLAPKLSETEHRLHQALTDIKHARLHLAERGATISQLAQKRAAISALGLPAASHAAQPTVYASDKRLKIATSHAVIHPAGIAWMELLVHLKDAPPGPLRATLAGSVVAVADVDNEVKIWMKHRLEPDCDTSYNGLNHP